MKKSAKKITRLWNLGYLGFILTRNIHMGLWEGWNGKVKDVKIYHIWKMPTIASFLCTFLSVILGWSSLWSSAVSTSDMCLAVQYSYTDSHDLVWKSHLCSRKGGYVCKKPALSEYSLPKLWTHILDRSLTVSKVE